jgi:hypothetical protein
MADQSSQRGGGRRTDSSARYRLLISDEAREQLRDQNKPEPFTGAKVRVTGTLRDCQEITRTS